MNSSYTPNWTPPVLETARLLLRPVTPADADAVFDACSNPNLTRFTLFDTHQSMDDTVAFVRHYVAASYAEGTPDPFAVQFKDDPTGRMIGAIGCHWASRGNQTLELGYWVGEPYWGRGIATEAGLSVLSHVFSCYAAHRVQARVIVGNRASVRVLEKIGFRYEGTLRRSLFRRGAVEDVMMFARVRADAEG